MATSKVTFTLDEATVHMIATRRAARQTQKPGGPGAVSEYHDRLGRYERRERLEKLRLLDTLAPLDPYARPRRAQRN